MSGQSSPVLTNCSFQNNTATYGGAISSSGSSSGISSPVMTDCVFLNNVTFNFGGASFNLGGALFNLSVGGTSSATLTNCTFLGNKSQEGGAIYNTVNSNGSCNPVLTNCSFQSNTALYGGGIYSDGSSSGISIPSLTNCVLFGNGGNNTFYNTAATITATYSLFDNTVIGYLGSTGNLTTIASPFISTTSVALVACSPAINAGLTSANSTTVDLAGNPRVVEGRIDMGAVEFQGATTLAVGVTANPSLTITQGQTLTLTASGALSYSWSTGLSTTAISVSVAGPYTVTGVTGSCSGTATVTVTVTAAPPSITAQPASASTVCEGASVVVTVDVSGSVSGYQWLRGGSPVPGQTGPTLLLGNVPVSDAGVYSLSVSGLGGSVTSNGFTLTVSNFAPTVVITLPNGSTVNVAGDLPTLILPSGNSVLQASGGVLYERLIILDRINGYEVRQVDRNTTGIFTINRLGLFTLTVTGAGGCSRTVQGVVQAP